jgi:hypothetical protein
MHSSIAIVAIAAALIVAAGLAAQGGIYAVTGAGESAYLVNRWTGQAWLLSGATARPVRPVLPQSPRDFQK